MALSDAATARGTGKVATIHPLPGEVRRLVETRAFLKCRETGRAVRARHDELSVETKFWVGKGLEATCDLGEALRGNPAASVSNKSFPVRI